MSKRTVTATITFGSMSAGKSPLIELPLIDIYKFIIERLSITSLIQVEVTVTEGDHIQFLIDTYNEQKHLLGGERLATLKAAVKRFDDKMDGRGEFENREPRTPTGDDYNEISEMVWAA